MTDRETIIESGDGGAAAMIAGLLVVALLVVGFFFFFGYGNKSRAIDIDVPNVTVDVTPNGQQSRV